MEASPLRTLGPARIVALTLIALVGLGLALLRAESRHHALAVPAGAHAGQLTLHACHYGTANGSYAADCGTLVVPENRHDPRSRLIALPVTRIRARSAHPGTPIFRLEGGPGLTNMQFPNASRFAGTRDVVLVGYRGVDGSSKLDCPEVASAREHARDLLTAQAYRADAVAFAACARRLRQAGFDLAGYTLPERVDDLEAARGALGYAQVDLLSESAGTRTAMIYAWRYPQRIRRSVMIGANPPGDFLWDARTTGEQIDRYAALCAADAACRARTPDLAESLHAAMQHLPSRWWFLRVKPGNVRAAAFFGLMNATTEGAGPLSGPSTIETLLQARSGGAGGAWLLGTMAQLAFPRAQVWGDVAAVGRSDGAAARRFFAAHADQGSTIGAPGTDLIWAGGRLLDVWPASPDDDRYATVQDSNVETLLVGGSLDLATPPQNATRTLLPHLSRGKQVVLGGLGHTDDFWTVQPAASTRLIDAFLDSGRVDTSLYTPARVDFTPATSHGTIAAIVLASLLGLAAVAVLSLLFMALRVSRRRVFGRTTSAALRSLHALVVGLGGWCLGALFVLTAAPTVPLDDEALALVAIGVPVGLVVALASASRAGRYRSVARFAVALEGALVGAWLGLHAAPTLVAPIAAIAGATAAANLGVLALDIHRDRSVRRRVATATARVSVEAPA